MNLYPGVDRFRLAVDRTTDARWSAAAHMLQTGGWALSPAPGTIPVPATYNATVTRVYDGDTIYVDVHYVGQLHSVEQPVRLLGCNAAELRTPGGDAAKANLVALLPVGTPVVLSEVGTDKYAPRWDCSVALLLAGVPTDLVAYLVAQQWAAPWDGKGTKPLPPWPRTVA